MPALRQESGNTVHAGDLVFRQDIVESLEELIRRFIVGDTLRELLHAKRKIKRHKHISLTFHQRRV
jgi:hypothetical protein